MGKAAELIDRGADFSADRVYRFRLWRRWEYGPMLAVVGLNPSTADETTDDSTVRRAIGYARDWGFAGLRMLNLFSFRATDPKVMKQHYEGLSFGKRFDALCQNRDKVVRESRLTIGEGGAVLAAWGTHGAFHDEGEVMSVALGWYPRSLGIACLGTTKEGHPKHVLYLPKDAQPVAYCNDGGRLVAGGEAR